MRQRRRYEAKLLKIHVSDILERVQKNGVMTNEAKIEQKSLKIHGAV